MSPKSFEDRFLELLIENVNSKVDDYRKAKKQLDDFVKEQDGLSWEGDIYVPEVRE